MAHFSSNHRTNSRPSKEWMSKTDEGRSKVLASCYMVNSSSMALGSLHYSTPSTRAGGKSSSAPAETGPKTWLMTDTQGPSGVPEVSSGGLISATSPSPTTHASRTCSAFLTKSETAGGEEAAYTITEECERLFCEKLRAIFLGERKTVGQDSLVTGMRRSQRDYFVYAHVFRLEEWLEVWDYASNLEFRGFVGSNGDERSLVVFFDSSIVGHDLKPG
ncbi:hypothetical protein MMC20_000931 [Loxospora ochrophaea]|nr:hypothetical protein [Loxospora ochrophaea]